MVAKSDEPKGEQPPVMWVVEVLQRTGRWRPVAAPAMGPYTKAAAEQRKEELIEEYPFLANKIRHAAKFKMIDPVRVRPYSRIDIRWHEPKEPNLMDEPIKRE